MWYAYWRSVMESIAKDQAIPREHRPAVLIALRAAARNRWWKHLDKLLGPAEQLARKYPHKPLSADLLRLRTCPEIQAVILDQMANAAEDVALELEGEKVHGS